MYNYLFISQVNKLAGHNTHQHTDTSILHCAASYSAGARVFFTLTRGSITTGTSTYTTSINITALVHSTALALISTLALDTALAAGKLASRISHLLSVNIPLLVISLIQLCHLFISSQLLQQRIHTSLHGQCSAVCCNISVYFCNIISKLLQCRGLVEKRCLRPVSCHVRFHVTKLLTSWSRVCHIIDITYLRVQSRTCYLCDSQATAVHLAAKRSHSFNLRLA